jgi:glutamyl-tRNA reductase
MLRGRDSQLDQLVVASLTVAEADADSREALAARLSERGTGAAEQVVVHTCHRVELIAVVEAADHLVGLADGMQRSTGLAAAERVMLVAAGLDSAVLAEEQVLGQVRDAYQAALGRGQTGPVTNELLRRAIRFGKRVRSFAQPGGDRSLADRAARWVDEQRRGLQTEAPPRALVIGTGEMGRTLAARFAADGAWVTLASRSESRAQDCIVSLPHAERHRATAISEVMAGVLGYEIVAIAVRSGTIRLEGRHLNGTVPIVVDLSVPRTVAADAAARLGDRLLDIDRLGVADEARSLSAEVELRLRSEALFEASEFAAWLAVRGSGDGIAILRAHGEEVRRRHVERLRLRSSLSAEQMTAVEAMTASMVGELLHGPTVRLRHDPDTAMRVREVFGIE